MAFCPYNWKFEIECTSECALYKNGECGLARDAGALESAPPSGKHKVTNLYYNPETGRLDVEYSDTPEE
jgi:hypothetical protein